MPETVIKTVLKGGEFLIKEVGPQQSFIPEDLNEEQEMIRQVCIDFVNNDVNANNKGGKLEYQAELLGKAGELGLLASHIPEEYGGMLMDVNTNTVISEELGIAMGGYATSFAAHIGIGTLPILYFGTEAQKQKYLPGLASGEFKAAYCLTEPGSGSDALAAKTRADWSEKDNCYLLNGQKMWITNAGFADVFIVFAQIDGDKFSSFIVDAHSAGISLGAEEAKLGIKGSSTRQVFFENVKITKDDLLGEIGKGHLIAFNILNIGRFKLGVMSAGGAKKAITIGTKYANERHQFNQPISSFGAIQYKIAEQVIRTFALESACYRVSNLMKEKKTALLAEGETYTAAILESAEEYAIECALIKVSGSETAAYCVDELVQIHGGYGFSEEYPAATAYRDARISRIYEGTNEINRLLSVSMLMKRAMKGSLDIVGHAWNVQKELASMPVAEANSGKYAAEIKAVKDFKKIILMVAGGAAKKQMDGQFNMKTEQETVMNISDLMIDTFNAESTLLRVQKLADRQNNKVNQEVYDAILKVHVADATARIQKNATDALASFAEGDLLRTFLMGLKRYTKYPPVNVKEERRKIAAVIINANKYCL